jgi:hypothetical protein
MPGGDACPSCGARLGGPEECQAAFEQLSAQAWSSPARGAIHNLVVDTFAMQHSEGHGKSAKSYAAHLTALCCAIEAGGDRQLYWAIARWLDGPRPATIERPADLSFRGRLTIAGVLTPEREEDYPDLVRRWAVDVWNAYASQHELARAWLDAVRAFARTSVRRSSS